MLSLLYYVISFHLFDYHTLRHWDALNITPLLILRLLFSFRHLFSIRHYAWLLLLSFFISLFITYFDLFYIFIIIYDYFFHYFIIITIFWYFLPWDALIFSSFLITFHMLYYFHISDIIISSLFHFLIFIFFFILHFHIFHYWLASSYFHSPISPRFFISDDIIYLAFAFIICYFSFMIFSHYVIITPARCYDMTLVITIIDIFLIFISLLFFHYIDFDAISICYALLMPLFISLFSYYAIFYMIDYAFIFFDALRFIADYYTIYALILFSPPYFIMPYCIYSCLRFITIIDYIYLCFHIFALLSLRWLFWLWHCWCLTFIFATQPFHFHYVIYCFIISCFFIISYHYFDIILMIFIIIFFIIDAFRRHIRWLLLRIAIVYFRHCRHITPDILCFHFAMLFILPLMIFYIYLRWCFHDYAIIIIFYWYAMILYCFSLLRFGLSDYAAYIIYIYYLLLITLIPLWYIYFQLTAFISLFQLCCRHHCHFRHWCHFDYIFIFWWLRLRRHCAIGSNGRHYLMAIDDIMLSFIFDITWYFIAIYIISFSLRLFIDAALPLSISVINISLYYSCYFHTLLSSYFRFHFLMPVICFLHIDIISFAFRHNIYIFLSSLLFRLFHYMIHYTLRHATDSYDHYIYFAADIYCVFRCRCHYYYITIICQYFHARTIYSYAIYDVYYNISHLHFYLMLIASFRCYFITSLFRFRCQYLFIFSDIDYSPPFDYFILFDLLFSHIFTLMIFISDIGI